MLMPETDRDGSAGVWCVQGQSEAHIFERGAKVY